MHKFLNFLCIFCILLFTQSLHLFAEEKIKIGLLIPMTGENKQLGQSIIKSSIMALEDIDSNKIEIFPKNTNSNPNSSSTPTDKGCCGGCQQQELACYHAAHNGECS